MAAPATDTPPQELPAEGWLALANKVFRNGEFFRAFDLAQAGLRAHPDNLALKHRAVLSLANSGALDLAAEQFVTLGLDAVETVEILSLGGRIATDFGFRHTGDARAYAFAEAAASYGRAYEVARASGSPDAYYPAINGAYLALLAGHEEEAARRSAEVLHILGDRIEAARDGDPLDRYWVLATAIEAYLLTGDIAAAQALVPHAVSASGNNPSNLSSTWRQLERILHVKSLPLETLAGMAPAKVVHYLGHIIAPPGQPGRFTAEEEAPVTAELERTLDGFNIGVAYGALAAGADIILAEALLRRGAALHVVLPFARDDFVELSVRPSGESWVPRFEACMAQAQSIRYATEDRHLGDDHLFAYGSQIAMGLAVLYGRHLHADLRQIAIWDGESSDAVAGTAIDIGVWERAGMPRATVIPCGNARHASRPVTATPVAQPPPGGRRHSRAMLFGDVSGFSQLTDEQLPGFTAKILGAMGRVIGRFREHTDMVNTWGDGLFIVFADAGIAANCALALQDAISAVDLEAARLPHHLSLRLGGHLGPVYELPDPILSRPNFYGAHVSRAARIEPIVPSGCVYVTETFAAILALSCAESLACDYVGWTDMPKKYGRLRMFLLRPRDGRLEPTVLTDIEQVPVAVSK
jgi:class 3 adenylate cyclase/tetratricopeptide (TPR) repeat protein